MKCVVHIVGSFLDKNDSEVYVGYLCGLGQFGDGLAVAMVLGAMVVLSGALVGRFGPQWSMPVLVVACRSRSIVFPNSFAPLLLRYLSVVGDGVARVLGLPLEVAVVVECLAFGFDLRWQWMAFFGLLSVGGLACSFGCEDAWW